MLPILIVTPELHSSSELQFERVFFIRGNLNDIEILKRANLEKAHTVLIPTSIGDVSRSDGESVFSLLAALTVSPETRVCVEIASADNGETLQKIRERNLKAGEIEIVSFESVAERLLAQSAINRGVTRVYNELLSFSETSNEVYTSALGAAWHGKSFRDLAAACFENTVMLIGYETELGLALNPPNRDYVFNGQESVWFISFNKAAGLSIINPHALRS